ncbi:MAG: spermidine/putrescine transporter ATPase subunit [Rubritepida sp.]|nr:spermidine/putrescine transporter ATPase subunit [Rubritepida sp.]
MSALQRGEVVVRNLAKRYGSYTAVADVSLRAAPGEFISLIGPSGSGKTTTLMMIAGFSNPDAGAIWLDGQDITDLSPQKRQLGMVFQNYAIFPHMTVAENIAFPLRVRRWSKSKITAAVNEVLRLVNLQAYADRLPRQLSGGQQQRVALARAIVFRPQVILMDEPLGALDKNLRYQMQSEIKDLQRKLGTTVIYVTHDQEEALNMSDRLIVMDHGKIEQAGRPSEIYDKPATAFVARFLGEANLLPIRAVGADGDAIMVTTPGGKTLRVRNADTVVAEPASLLFVRPEKVRMTSGCTPAEAALNTFPGSIRGVSFLGSMVRYTVDIQEAEPVLVDVANDTGATLPGEGEAVTLEFSEAVTRVISA